MSILSRIRTWLAYVIDEARHRFDSWRFWYSPPWRKTRRCPECAGRGSKLKRGDEFTCQSCGGAGHVTKHP